MGWDENTSLCQRCLVERRNTALELVKASTDGPWEDASQLILEADRINRAILTIPASG